MKQFSIVEPDTIRKHQTNNSPSKIAHQFSKTKRFPDINPECPNAFYSFDSQLSKRRTGFGFGDKFDFTKPLTVSPPSTKYNHKSFTEDSKVKGLTFGLSREVSPDRSYLIPQLQKNPAPNKYNNEKLKQNNFSFTIRPKTLDVLQKDNTSRKAPSSAAYNTIELVPKDGRFFVSKFGDTKLSSLNMKADRFQAIKQSPGPGAYIQKDGLHGNAKYLLSNHRGDGTRAFSMTARFKGEKWTNLLNPGPGTHEKPSDFGSYGDARYYKTLNSFRGTE